MAPKISLSIKVYSKLYANSLNKETYEAYINGLWGDNVTLEGQGTTREEAKQKAIKELVKWKQAIDTFLEEQFVANSEETTHKEKEST